MTVASPITRHDYTGTGTTGPFPYAFRIFAATDLELVVRDAATGLETVLEYPGDFAVTGVGERSGGAVTLTQALAAGDTLSILRNVPVLQETEFRSGGAFLQEMIEKALDKVVMMVQRHQDRIDRSVSLPRSLDPYAYDLELPTPEAGKAIVWNADGTGLDNAALDEAQLSTWSASQNQRLDTFIDGTHFTAGTSTTLALTNDPGDIANLLVWRRTGGVVVPFLTDEFSVDANGVITFVDPIPANTTRVEARYFRTYQVNVVDAQNARYNHSGAGARATDVRTRLRALDIDAIVDYAVATDGTSDASAAINAALAAAAAAQAAGGTGAVCLGAGTFIVDSKITIPDQVILRGAGLGRTILKQKDAANLATMIEFAAGGVRMALRDVTVDANQAGNTGAGQQYVVRGSAATDTDVTRVEVRNFYGLTGSTGNLVAVNGDRCVVQDCWIHDGGNIAALHQADGIYLKGANCRAVRNIVERTTDTAIVMENCTNPLVAENILDDNVQGIAVGAGIVGSTPAGGNVTGNIISRLSRYNGQAILLYKVNGTSNQRIAVTGNTIYGSTAGAGIFCWQSDYATLSGNTISAIDGTAAEYRDGMGIIVRNSKNVTVVGNTVTDCASCGLLISGAQQFLVTGNNILNCGLYTASPLPGIAVQTGPAETSGSSALTNVDGRFLCNVSSGASATRGIILYADGDNLLLVGNDFRGNQSNPGYLKEVGFTGNVRMFANLTSSTVNAYEQQDFITVNGGLQLMNGKLQTAASTATVGGAALAITPGAQPSTANDGDIWYDAGANELRILKNGTIRNILTS